MLAPAPCHGGARAAPRRLETLGSSAGEALAAGTPALRGAPVCRRGMAIEQDVARVVILEILDEESDPEEIPISIQ